MARTTDLLDTLGVAEDGITIAYPDTFLDDMRGAYTQDTEAYDAKIAVLTADLAAANEKILLLQAHNYELMTMTPATEPGAAAEEEELDDDKPAEDNDDNSGVDALFDKKDD